MARSLKSFPERHDIAYLIGAGPGIIETSPAPIRSRRRLNLLLFLWQTESGIRIRRASKEIRHPMWAKGDRGARTLERPVP